MKYVYLQTNDGNDILPDTVRHVAPQHRERVVTADYCNVTAPCVETSDI